MTPTKQKGASALSYLRGAMVAVALSLPLLSLSAFGIWWLWQNNLLMIWSASATVAALFIYSLQALIIWQTGKKSEKEPTSKTGATDTPEPRGLTPREQRAWDAIEVIAKDIDPATLTDREAILQVGIDTVHAVANQMHPDEKEPLWKFTVPEALSVTEQVSSQLKAFVENNIPLGDQLTIGQLLALYRWRGVIGASERAYDLWRILRFANPASAIAGELREKVSGKLIAGMRTELTKRLARAYVREVGQAAIDLYSGRLRPSPSLGSSPDSTTSRTVTEDRLDRPISILLIGQSEAGKTSVAVALSEKLGATVETMKNASGDTISVLQGGHEEFSAIIIEAPAIEDEQETLDRIVDQAMDADVVVSIISASRPDRELDRKTLTAIEDAYSKQSSRRQPPVCVVLTGIDKLRPFREWQPPYDLNDPQSAKATSIREAAIAVSDDLNVESSAVVPVMTELNADTYNIDVLWSKLLELAPDARKANIARQLDAASKSSISWKQLWNQSMNAGRVIGRTVLKGRPGSTSDQP